MTKRVIQIHTRRNGFVLTRFVDAWQKTGDGDGHENVPKGMDNVIILFGGLSEAGDAGGATDSARQNVKDGIMLTRETPTTSRTPVQDGRWMRGGMLN